MKVEFNNNIITDLLRQRSDLANEVYTKFPKIIDWEKGTEKPTLVKLVGLAKYFNIPFGYFFLNRLPQKEYPIPHYRTKGTRVFKPSQELLETISTLEERQEWARDFIMDLHGGLSFVNSVTPRTSIKITADKIRTILNVDVNWAKNPDFKKWDDAFRFLIRKVEDAGIFVVVNGVVNNNTFKKLDVEEFRGFVLSDKFAPFIFINGNDFVSGKIFTIIHEVAHVLVGKSASFDYDKLIPASDEIENYCDAVATEFLLPERILNEAIQRLGDDYELLANMFKVSRVVIAKRLLESNIITEKQFYLAYKKFRILGYEKSFMTSTGGNFYNTAPYRISRRFFNLVYSYVKQDKILYRDAFKITGLTPKSFDGYVKEHIG